MREDGNRSAHRAVKQDLLRRVGNVVRAANDVRNAHVDVVYNDAHLIHGLAKLFVALARTKQNEVFDFVVRKFALAKNSVEKFCRAADRHFETHGRLKAGSGGLAVAARAASDAANLGSFGARFSVVAADILFRRAIA